MTAVSTVFGITALVIFIGFLSTLLFEKTRVPDVLILILLGIIIGPATGLINSDELIGLAEVFGALALTLILFDGGLELKYHEVVRKFGSTLVLLGASFTISMISIAIVFQLYQPDAPVYLSLSLGAILSAVSATIVIPILSIMRVKSETKALLNLESALTDVAAIFVVFLLLGSIGPRAELGANIQVGIIVTILFSTVIAVVLGIAWLELLRVMKGRAYSYMITLATVLGLYAIVEYLGGAGAVSALVFGIVLSNGKELSRRLPIKTDFELDERLRWFHSEVTFFLKTFFFVFMGILFAIELFTVELLIFSMILLLLIVGARVLAVKFLVIVRPQEREEQDVLTIMMPRGLTSVVLVVILATTAAMDVSFLMGVAFTVIVFTNIIMTGGVFFVERRRMKALEIPPKELEVIEI